MINNMYFLAHWFLTKKIIICMISLLIFASSKKILTNIVWFLINLEQELNHSFPGKANILTFIYIYICVVAINIYTPGQL